MTGPDERDRLDMLAAGGAFHGDTEVLTVLARAAAFRRYRRGDVLIAAGAAAGEALFVVSGTLAVGASGGDTEIRIELVGAGQLLVLHETLAGGVSPVRVTAEADADILAIPAPVLHDLMESHRIIARDVAALAEARRLAIRPHIRLRTAA